MSLQLPSVSIPFVAEMSKLTAGVQQIAQMVNQASAQVRPITVQANTSGATTQVTALINQLRSLTGEMRAQDQANGQQRAAIAALVAQQAALRAQLSQTIEQLRTNGASAKELAAAHGNLRVAMLQSTAAIAAQRTELASGVAAQGQYRNAIAATREQLKLLEGDAHKASAAQKTANTATSSNRGGGGFIGGLASGTGGSALSNGVAFGAGAMAGREVYQAFAVTVGAAKDAIIGFNSSMEQSKIAFTTFLGGAQQADTFLAQLQQFALATPFAFPQLVEASKRMLAFGFSAQQVIPLLTSVGNAAAGLATGNAGIESMTLALGQIQAKGHVAGQELLQLQNAGVNTGEIMELIGKQTGQTTAEVKKMSEQGKLSSTIFIAAFQEWSKAKFGEMMEKQSRTFTGAMGNIHDAVVKVLSQMGQPLFTAISHAAQKLSDFTQTAQFARWAAAATSAVQSVINFLSQLLGMAGQVAGALGFKMPTLDMTPAAGNVAAAQAQEAAANGVAEAQAAAVREAAGYAAQVTDAEAHLKGITVQLNDVKDAQDAITNQVATIKQGYADQIQPLERQVAVMNQLSDAEKARAVRRNALEGEKIQLELSKPDTSELDAAIQQLQRDKQDLGKFDSSQWDTALKGLHDQLNVIAHEDTKTLDHAIQGVQESLYQLGRENTHELDAQIKTLTKNISNLGKHATDTLDAQIQSLHDKIDGLSTVAIDALDEQAKALHAQIDSLSTASIDSMTKQLDELQERLKGFNTDDLDRQIAHLQAKMNEPPPDTSGMSNQLALLASQLGGPNDAGVRQQFGALSAQKAGILTAQQLKENAFKQQLASLEAERTAQKLANDDSKRAIQNQIDGITETRKSLIDANAERRKGWEDEIKAIERHKQQLVDDNNEARKGWEGQIKAAEHQKKGITDGITAQKEAMQATLDGLNEQKTGIEEERARRRDALQDQLHGMEQTKRLADEDRAARRDAIQEQIDGQTKAKDAAKAVFDANMANIDANILALTRQKEDALAPYNAAMKRIEAESRIIGLLDQQDALTRKIAEAPLLEKIAALKQAEQDTLLPLERQSAELARQARALEGQKRQWEEIKTAAEDASKAMIPPDAPKPGGMPDVPASPEGFIGPMPPTGITKWLGEHKQEILDAFGEIKSIIDHMGDGFEGFAGAGIAAVDRLDVHMQDFVRDHTSGFWYEMIYGKRKLPSGMAGPEESIGVVQQMDDLLKQLDAKLRANNIPVTWGEWWKAIKTEFTRGKDDNLLSHDEFVRKLSSSTTLSQTQIEDSWKDYYRATADQRKSGDQVILDDFGMMFSGIGTKMREFKTNNWDKNWKDVEDDVTHATTWISDRFGDIKKDLTTNGSDTDNWQKSDWAPHLSTAEDNMTHLTSWVEASKNNMVGFFGDLGTDVSNWQKSDFAPHLSTAQQNMTELRNWIGDRKGDIGGFFSGMGSDAQGAASAIGDAFSGLGNVIHGHLQGALDHLSRFVNQVAAGAAKVLDFFGLGHPGGLDAAMTMTLQLPGGFIGPPAPKATGDMNFAGGPALIGEAGRELYHAGGGWKLADQPTLLNLPSGATVLPNNVTEELLASGVPGFAGGLIGDALGKAKTLAGDALNLGKRGAQAVYDHTVGALPDLSMPGAFADVGPKLVETAKNGLMESIKNALGIAIPRTVGSSVGHGVNLSGTSDIIEAIRAVTGDSNEQLAMLFGAAMETGLQNIAQIGGGPGAGYWQIEAGPGGQYAGQVDPYNVMAAAAFMEPDYHRAMPYGDFGGDFETALAQVAYHAERPAVMYAKSQQDAAWSLIQAYIGKSGISSGGGGDVGTIEGMAGDQLLSIASSVAGRLYWCEQYIGDAMQAAGLRYARAGSAQEHAGMQPLSPGLGPMGAIDFFPWTDGAGNSYGHVAFSMGDGHTVFGTRAGTPDDPSQVGRLDVSGWQPYGYTLNPMATGAYVTGPTPALVGEGRHPEIVSPVPMMRQTVKDAILDLGRSTTGIPSRTVAPRAAPAGDDITVVFEAGSISVDKDGNPTVNKNPITLRQAKALAGLPG